LVLADRLHHRLEELFKQTRTNLKALLSIDDGEFGKGVRANKPINWDWGVNDWYYPFGKSKQWYVAWGFAPAASLALEGDRYKLHVFVYVGKEQNERRGIPPSMGSVPGLQRRDDENEGDYLFTSIAAADLFERDEFSNDFVNWVKPGIKSGLRILNASNKKCGKGK